MKNNIGRTISVFGLISIFSAVALLFSCSEGIFNFNEETGNISISFTAESSVGVELDKVVFNLGNDSTGASVRRECEIYNWSGEQGAEAYISRADTGSWQIYTSVYDTDGNIVAERRDQFELALARTVIAEFEYFSTGDLNLYWETPAGFEPESLLNADKMNALIIASHTAGEPVENTGFQTILIVEGTGFDVALGGIEVSFPDDGYFSYDGGWARAVNDISVETSSTLLSVTRADYNSRGNYSMIISDTNDVETELFDYCDFGFEPDYGLATISGYTGAATIADTMYDKNGSASAGTYIAYTVDSSDGTLIGGTSPTVFEDPSSITNLDMSGNLANGLVVLCTLDADLSQADIDGAYMRGTTDVSPEKLPGWLYSSFEDRINFIGLSVQSY